MSAKCQNVEHDDYCDRQRRNCIDGRKIMRMDDTADSVRIAGCKSTTFGCDLLANWIKKNYTANGGVKEVSVFTEDRNVGHDDYDDRRRTNYNDNRRTMQMDSRVDSVRIAG